jgi:hypothetical protein
VTITRNSDSLTLLCVHCGCRVMMVGLGWRHLDMTGRCETQPIPGRTVVATPTLWTETEYGEPF